MKKIIAAALFTIIAIGAFMLFYTYSKKDTDIMKLTNSETSDKAMKISSSAFADKGSISEKYTCNGQNVSPPLSFSEVPQEAKSLALIVEDPDAPAGTFNHWLVWNINPQTKEISEGQPPQEAKVGNNDFGVNAYGGPCPPSGVHKYRFRLYALDSTPEIPQNSKQSDLEKSMDGHILEEALLTGLYQRS